MKKLDKKVIGLLSKILAIVAALSGLIGGAIAYDQRKADQSEVDLLSSRLEQKIVQDRMENIQRRIWLLEDRYGGRDVPNAPVEVREEYRELLHELESLKRRGK